MHPLKQYLQDVEETVSEFAARVGASRQTLYRICTGDQQPKPLLAQRIVEATGGAVSLNMLYADGADIIEAPIQAADSALDLERLRIAITIVVNHLLGGEVNAPEALIAIATEAADNTYAALSRFTSRGGPDRLAQALRPVIEETLRECAAEPAPTALDHGARLAAQMYYRTAVLRRD